MGRSVVAAVETEGDMEVVASVDPALTPGEGRYPSLPPALAACGLDVVVDFTQPDVVFANARDALRAGVHAVVGTTGLTEGQLDELRALAESGPANIVVAPNFAIGAVLMMRFAAEASRHMGRGEIVELHHAGTLDAPSGTALRTAGMMDGEVPIHSVRLPGLVAHQEVLLGGHGETLTIRHDSLSRESFMPGVVMAVRAVPKRPGLTLGLEPILFGGA
jgi:4-hydroxy-tetrahydrodipicolinate reductase